MWLKHRRCPKKADHCNTAPRNLHMPRLKLTLKKLLHRFSTRSKPSPRGVYPRLTDLCPQNGLRVPRVLTLLVRELERHHLNADAIYKRPGNADEVEFILRNFDSVILESVDAHCLAECVKTFLWQLQEPLIPSDRLDDFVEVLRCEDREGALRSSMSSLPAVNRDTLHFMIIHWRKVLDHSLQNGLTRASLATVLAPFVAGFDNEQSSIDITDLLLKTGL